MDMDLYLLFVGTCVVLGLIPGLNIALIVANSIAHGTRYSLVSVAGTSSAMVPQLAVTVLGATTILTFMSSAFEGLRWVGVAYLLYLGFRHWFTKVDSCWAVLAGRARSVLSKFSRLRHRISGAFFITAGVGLALARKP